MNCRNLLLAATAMGLCALIAAPAAGKDRPVAQQKGPAAAAPAVQAAAAPRKATAEERAEADRLDPLARAAFWANEVDIDGRDLVAGVKLSAALRALGRNDEAAVAARRVLVIDPDDTGGLFELARDAIAAGQGFYAIAPLTKLQARDAKDWKVLSLLGVAYEQVSREADAEAAWTQALQLSPDNPAVLTNLGLHYAAKGDTGRAETLLRKAAVQPGAGLKERQDLALVLGLQGKFDEAEALERQDLPPDMAANNIAYLRAAGSRSERTWQSVQGAELAVN